ncbi:hypothetical protein DSO57_1033091 [Entomophthora muscae]|uniref:Uncharacterized protein n=1 Tax=Entomophthora muscae TaxID=34485 RepID=A0ACC2S296_9FUNG|nr:hypothetical protein DSO57_1033091 [Entomophthora muscae]
MFSQLSLSSPPKIIFYISPEEDKRCQIIKSTPAKNSVNRGGKSKGNQRKDPFRIYNLKKELHSCPPKAFKPHPTTYFIPTPDFSIPHFRDIEKYSLSKN